MSPALYLVGILGIVVLMIVHEGGHYLAARKFGMRVVRFSIGFGPTIWKYQPKGSPTVYQFAIIPFLAYVQIAGMNPYEDIDPKDPGSYANASLWGRIVTIAAGPLANYLFASIFFFASLVIGGKPIADESSMRITVSPGGPAQLADMRTGDKLLRVNETPVPTWTEVIKSISSHPGERIRIEVERDGQVIEKDVTPLAEGDKGRILISPYTTNVRIGLGEATKISLMNPPLIVYKTFQHLGRWIAGKEKGQIAGPVGIMKESALAADAGVGSFLWFLGIISTSLGAFNLLPFPALDGGRLLFLGIEAASRRRPDAKIEAKVHALGLLMLLAIIAVVTYADIMGK